MTGPVSPVATMHVLVIDDDVVLREFLEALLPLEGHTVLSAETGAAGVAALEQSPAAFDAILCDLHLPGADTASLAAQLNALRSSSTVLLAMSATRPAEIELQPFDGFLLKPFQPSDLTDAVERARSSGPRLHAPGDPAPNSSEATDVTVLDEAIFSKLSAALPAAQLLELYNMTLADVAQRVEQMRAAQAAGDHQQLQREAHAVKGGCGMVGAAELRELAAEAEGGAPECTPPLEDFLRASERLRRMLNERLA